MYGVYWALIRIFVACFIFFDELWSLGLLIKLVKDEGLCWPVAGTFRASPEADVALWFGFVAADLSLITVYSTFDPVKSVL